MKSCSSSTRKKPKKKRLTSFLHMFSTVQHLLGLMTFLITRNVKAVEISRSDVDRYISSFAVKKGEFWNINGTLYSTQRRMPTNFIALRSRLVLVLLIYHRFESGSGATFAKLPFSSSCANYFKFPSKQIKGHFKTIISQPTFQRMQPLNLETINQS